MLQHIQCYIKKMLHLSPFFKWRTIHIKKTYQVKQFSLLLCGEFFAVDGILKFLPYRQYVMKPTFLLLTRKHVCLSWTALLTCCAVIKDKQIFASFQTHYCLLHLHGHDFITHANRQFHLCLIGSSQLLIYFEPCVSSLVHELTIKRYTSAPVTKCPATFEVWIWALWVKRAPP